MPMADSTIYRNLRLMAEAGIIAQKVSPDVPKRFRRLAANAPQFFLHCRNCGVEEVLDDSALRNAVADYCCRHGLDLKRTVLRLESEKMECDGSCDKNMSMKRRNQRNF